MGSVSTNIANIQQSFMNNITQQDQQNCIATSNPTSNNNIIITNGANIGGDFTGVSQTTTTDASCLIVSNIESSISNILSSTINQTNTSETDWFNGFQFTGDTNSYNLSQSVTNNISQLNEATCAANSASSTNNNYVYVTNSNIGGDFVGVDNSSSAAANCSMTNLMKTTTYNQAQGSSNQSNTIKGMFVAMVGSFAAIVGLVVIAVIILFAVGAIGFVGYEASGSHKSSSQSSNSIPSQTAIENQELAEASALGLTPEVLSALATS